MFDISAYCACNLSVQSVQIVVAPAHCLTPVHAKNHRKHTMVVNCTQKNEVLEKYYLSPFYAVEFCIGFPSNLVVVLGYIFCLQEWQSCNIYVFNLAISDLVFLCTLPHLAYLYANKYTVNIPSLCVINRYVLHVNLYSSILFMVWISMDRFLLIKYPMRNHYMLRPRVAQVVTGLTWLVVNVEVGPMIALMVQDLQRQNWSHCEDFASLKGDVNPLGYSLGLTITGYILPLLILCAFSQKISHLLHMQERAVQHRTSYRRPLRIVASATVMFFILYTPYHVLRNVRIASQQPWAEVHSCPAVYIEAMYILARPLAFLHSVINPVFYFLMGDKFRELLISKIRKMTRKTELRREPA
ncbi:LOW QUALITY PROTEIN: succinate receptor 1-like [Anableps anableps]